MTLTFHRGPEYRSLPREPQPWVIKPLVAVSGLTNLYGKPKSFKSFMALGMAFAVANGNPDWEGFPILKPGPVAYLQIDTPREEWAGRIDKLVAAGYDDSNLFIADMNTVPYPYNVLDPKHHAELKAALEAFKPVLVVVDTLRESFRGNENESDIMRDVIGNLVAASMPAAMILLSHQRKDGIAAKMGGEDMMDDNRGSSYVPGRMDVIIKKTEHRFMYKGRGAAPGSRDTEFIEDPGIVRVTGQRMRNEAAEKVRKFLSQLQTLGLPTNISMRDAAKHVVEAHPEWGKSFESVRKWAEFQEAFKQWEAQANYPKAA